MEKLTIGIDNVSNLPNSPGVGMTTNRSTGLKLFSQLWTNNTSHWRAAPTLDQRRQPEQSSFHFPNQNNQLPAM